ncbi:porin family protein [Methylosinus sp. H3A]|uniref:outer membrane protein n=1 Tax=Methylosinus sp. H3A TaxID=2785786 RepID=UPI0018C2EA9B|nr:outer membrane protein [Methylosinus sp. H3A]MBG0808279.1 porin family protein [Methylosinus sp. H3A]
MRRFVLTVVSVVAANAARAADLPSTKALPEEPRAVFTWKGFYIGAHAGVAWAHDESANILYGNPSIASSSFDATGVIGGLHLGYNWQVGNWVLGLEGDVDATGLEGTVASRPGTTYFSSTSRSPVQGSIRGRIGYAFDHLLLYATGGGIWTGILTSYRELPIGDSFSRTRESWTVGGGVEYALNNNWSVRGEYRFADFGRYYDGPAKAPLYQQSHHWDENQVKFGVTWKYTQGGTQPLFTR